MANREKVIKGLEQCISADKTCTGCPYEGTTCTTTLNEDALVLIKEQEPQPVIFDRQCEVEPNHWERKGFCPKCHQVILWMVNREYCGFCGQAVKWE